MSVQFKKVVWWASAVVGAILSLNVIYFVTSSKPMQGKGVAALDIALGVFLLVISTKQLNILSKIKKKG